MIFLAFQLDVVIRSFYSFQDFEKTLLLHKQFVVTGRQKNKHQVPVLKGPILATVIKLPLLDQLVILQFFMGHLPSFF